VNPLLPLEAEVAERIQESPTIVTLRLRLVDPQARARYRFAPGQFNMLYAHGVGEVPVSLSSDPHEPTLLGHTIRALGRVTRVLAALAPGDRLGLRGPYGRGWPLGEAAGRDVLVVTGGLGCAPVVGVINYVVMRRESFGVLTIVQGVKHAEELIWRERYAYWSTLPDTRVLLAADHGGPLWPGHVGRVTGVFDRIALAPERTLVMLCGPEAMMVEAVRLLLARGVPEARVFLSMERNMQCAVGLCGHCQFGARLVCREGPIFAYPDARPLLGKRGF
jgi:NAD(P)H-flavin reductase